VPLNMVFQRSSLNIPKGAWLGSLGLFAPNTH